MDSQQQPVENINPDFDVPNNAHVDISMSNYDSINTSVDDFLRKLEETPSETKSNETPQDSSPNEQQSPPHPAASTEPNIAAESLPHHQPRRLSTPGTRNER